MAQRRQLGQPNESQNETEFDIPGVNPGGDNLFNANTQPQPNDTGSAPKPGSASPGQTVAPLPNIPPPATNFSQVNQPLAPGAFGVKPNYNTGGYAAPGQITARSGAAPAGYDQTKWADPNKQSPKYAVGGLTNNAITGGASNMTPELLASVQAAYPGTTQVNGTTVNIPGIGEVQIINDGQNRWDTADSFGSQPAGSAGAAPSAQLAGGAMGGGPMASGGGAASAGGGSDIDSLLKSLTSGDYNNSITSNRVKAARDATEIGRTAEMGNLDYELASRGLSGSGAETSALTRLGGNLGAEYGKNIESILADESQNADDRALTGLSLMSNRDTANQDRGLQRDLGMGRLSLDELLGKGQLALGNKTADNEFNLGNLNSEIGWNEFLGQNGLDREKFQFQQDNANSSSLQQLLTLLASLTGTSAGGYQ